MEDPNQDDEETETFDVFRDGKVHVLREECVTCIFRPHQRFVPGARVAELVRETRQEEGSSVICHKTIYQSDVHNAICRGWYDRLGSQDSIIRLANMMGIIEEVDEPTDKSSM